MNQGQEAKEIESQPRLKNFNKGFVWLSGPCFAKVLASA